MKNLWRKMAITLSMFCLTGMSWATAYTLGTYGDWKDAIANAVVVSSSDDWQALSKSEVAAAARLIGFLEGLRDGHTLWIAEALFRRHGSTIPAGAEAEIEQIFCVDDSHSEIVTKLNAHTTRLLYDKNEEFGAVLLAFLREEYADCGGE